MGGALCVRLLGKLGPAKKPFLCYVEHERQDEQEA